MRSSALPNENKDRQEKARILIVDDHPIVRQGLAQVLNQQADLLFAARPATQKRLWPQ